MGLTGGKDSTPLFIAYSPHLGFMQPHVSSRMEQEEKEENTESGTKVFIMITHKGVSMAVLCESPTDEDWVMRWMSPLWGNPATIQTMMWESHSSCPLLLLVGVSVHGRKPQGLLHLMSLHPVHHCIGESNGRKFQEYFSSRFPS